MSRTTRGMWQFPWRYKESIALVSGIIVIGFLLQLTVGQFDFSVLQYPVNLILGLLLIVLVWIAACTLRKSAFYQWFTGVPFSVVLIGALLVLGIIMGLTPQTIGHSHETGNLPARLGFDRMTTSWSFVLVYGLLLVSLGMLVARRLMRFNIGEYAFYLNHVGLWLFLFAAGLGAADMERYLMRVNEGDVEWRGTTGDDIVALPVAVELNDFYMEEYPPKLSIINRHTGEGQPTGQPDFYSIDPKRPGGILAGWDLRLETYIHEAVRNSDSTYHEVHMPGSSPAAYISVSDRQTGMTYTGWVCSGNMSQLYMVLNLDSTYCVAMTRPEPKRFVSDINVYRKDKEPVQTLLEVNKPYRTGAWTIYQHSYDEYAGKLSNYTVVELVYDPWLLPVYIGIGLLAMGASCMLWGGRKRKGEAV